MRTPDPVNAREAAKDLLRRYVQANVHEGAYYTEDWVRLGGLGYHGHDYCANVWSSGRIHVSQIGNVAYDVWLNLHEIWTELEDECRAGVMQHRLF